MKSPWQFLVTYFLQASLRLQSTHIDAIEYLVVADVVLARGVDELPQLGGHAVGAAVKRSCCSIGIGFKEFKTLKSR